MTTTEVDLEQDVITVKYDPGKTSVDKLLATIQKEEFQADVLPN